MQTVDPHHDQALADLQALYDRWRAAQNAFNETGGAGAARNLVDELKVRKRLSEASRLRGELNLALDSFLALHPDFDTNILSNPELAR